MSAILPKEAQALLAQGDALLIDVREPKEFMAEHIAYAVSIPLAEIEHLTTHLNIPAGKTLIFQCQKGGRGQKACDLHLSLRDHHHEIRNLTGGIVAWKEEGFPVIATTEHHSRIPLNQQVLIGAGSLILSSTIVGLLGVQLGFFLAATFSLALIFAGFTGWCGMAIVLSKMPWNRGPQPTKAITDRAGA
jgi:rhodanese-related sulfurtransferase